MNVFQNILPVFVLYDPTEIHEIAGVYTEESKAESEKDRLLNAGEYSFLKVRPGQVTNINGKWHLLGDIVNLS